MVENSTPSPAKSDTPKRTKLGSPTKAGRGFNRRKQAQNPNRPVVRHAKFLGKCEELKGHVYNTASGRQSNQFIKTTKEIAEHVGCSYKYRIDAKKAIESLEEPIFLPPADPPAGASCTDKRIWEKRVDKFVKKSTYYEENMKNAFLLIMGQCSNAMKAKLKAEPHWEATEDLMDALELLHLIWGIMINSQLQRYLPLAIHKSKRDLYWLYQDKTM